MHSKNFEKIKNWYEKGLWSTKQVHQAVEKGLITSEEFTEITGEPFQYNNETNI